MLQLVLACSVFPAAPAWSADGPAAAASVATAHPLIGTWSWSQFGGKCVETFKYGADGKLLSTSGEAVTEWLYVVTPQASEKNFYKLTLTSVRQNGKKDCSGDMVEEAGTSVQAFIQLSPAKDRYISCKSESLAACFGPLAKIK